MTINRRLRDVRTAVQESPSIWFAIFGMGRPSGGGSASAQHGRSAFGCRSDLFESRAPSFRRPSVAGGAGLVVAVVVLVT